ncbi:MAG: hypothetical protein RL508_286 [Actinomycetota bacterium]|jgi:protein-tyrosine phosphatase
MSVHYHQLIPNVFMGAAADVQDAVANEKVDTVVDLRHESEACEATGENINWIKVPLGDNAPGAETALYKQAIDEVVAAKNAGHKVMFHCGMGRGRTGTVATGVLLELGLAKTVDEAEAMAKQIRPQLTLQSVQREALEQLYSAK